MTRIQFARAIGGVLPAIFLVACGGVGASASGQAAGTAPVPVSAAPLPPAPPAPPTPPSPPSPPTSAVTTDYHLTFDDEFNSVDLSHWITADFFGMRTNGGDYQAQWFADPAYVPSYSTKLAYNPFSAANGALSITAKPTPATVFAGEDQSGKGRQPYVSGQLTSAHRYTQRYGYYELKAKLPAGKGLWSRFWLLTDDGVWPGEYDIFEVLGKETNAVHQTTHYRTATAAHLADGKTATTINPVDGQFHTYGLLWEKSGVTWYVDGVATLTQPNRIDIPMYALIDLAVGNDPGNLWPGNPDASTRFPAEMVVDYFRIYSNDPALPAATPQTGYTASALPSGLRVVTTSTTGPLPTGWTIGAIGNPELKGSSTWNPFTGEWILKGGGYGNQAQFAGTTLAADGQISANIDAVTTINSNDDRAGVAMRTGRENGAPEISLVYVTSQNSPASGTRLVLQSRGTGNMVELASTAIASGPVTVRLVRQGNVITGSYSTDRGTSWKSVGQTTAAALAGPALSGILVGGNQNNYLRLSRAIFTQVVVKAN